MAPVPNPNHPDAPMAGAGEFDCALCLKLLFEPATATCGHSFCKRCSYELLAAARAREDAAAAGSTAPAPGHSRALRCPICRAFLDKRWVPAPSVALGRMLSLTYPEEYQARQREEAVSPQPLPRLPYALGVDAEGNVRKVLPLFVLDCILPGQKMHLHVFEIRYRRLVQRALAETDRRFGMVGYDRSRSPSGSGEHFPDVGTEVEIMSCHELPDGRFQLEVVGRTMFKVIDRQLRDGYWEASVDMANVDVEDDVDDDNGDDDASATESSSGNLANANGNTAQDQENESDQRCRRDSDDMIRLGRDILDRFDVWEAHVKSNGWERHPTHMEQVKDTLGPVPCADQSIRLALWVAAAINPLPPLGVAKEIRPRVLSSVDDKERLQIVSDALDESLVIVKKRRGTFDILGMEVDVQILLLGAFGLFVGALVQNCLRRIFAELGLDSALLGVHGIL